MEPEKQVEQAVDKFPFAMVLASTFLKGAIFIIMNAPLILILLEQQQVANFASLVNNGILRIWGTAAKSTNNLVTFSAFFIISIVVGVLLTPFERLVTFLIVFIISKVKVVLGKRGKQLNFFSSSEMTAVDYGPFLAWLFANPSSKLHWEWELFNFYNFWSIFTNLLIFETLIVLILGSAISLVELLAGLLLTGMMLGFALLHSILMSKVHGFYKQEYISRKNGNN